MTSVKNKTMKHKKTIHWGILGLGKIAHKFAEDLEQVDGGQLYAVASRTEEKAKSFAHKFSAEKAYVNYQTLLEDPKVDTVYIATPHVFHKDWTIKALKAKKAVLCEKAFGMNANEVEEMIATAKRENVFLMEALWTYFLPHYRYVLDLVKENEVGPIQKLEADFGFKADYDPEKRLYNKKLGGGSLLDIGIYPVFAALTLLGIPENISAQAIMAKTEVDEEVDIQFSYQNGATASLKSTLLAETPTTCVLHFQGGTIRLNRQFHAPSSVTLEKNGNSEEIKFPVNTRGYNFEIAHVQEMLWEERIESPIMTFQKSRELIGLLDQIREKIGLQYE